MGRSKRQRAAIRKATEQRDATETEQALARYRLEREQQGASGEQAMTGNNSQNDALSQQQVQDQIAPGQRDGTRNIQSQQQIPQAGILDAQREHSPHVCDRDAYDHNSRAVRSTTTHSNAGIATTQGSAAAAARGAASRGTSGSGTAVNSTAQDIDPQYRCSVQQWMQNDMPKGMSREQQQVWRAKQEVCREHGFKLPPHPEMKRPGSDRDVIGTMVSMYE